MPASLCAAGVVNTELQRYLLPESVPAWQKPFFYFTAKFLLTPEEGAKTSIYLASSPEVRLAGACRRCAHIFWWQPVRHLLTCCAARAALRPRCAAPACAGGGGHRQVLGQVQAGHQQRRVVQR